MLHRKEKRRELCGLDLPLRDCHSVASEERIAELTALAERGLPLVPNRRDRDEPRRLNVSTRHHVRG